LPFARAHRGKTEYRSRNLRAFATQNALPIEVMEME